jgi:hypothetical protein
MEFASGTRSERNERGFALLIIVLLVALLALTGATLLDLVSVDLQIAGEHRKVVKAQMVADGALREVLGDRFTDDLLPEFDACGTGGGACPNGRYVWARDVGGGNFRKNPDNIPAPGAYGTIPLTEATSVVAQLSTIPSMQDNYEATVDYLRTGPPWNSGQGVVRAYIYEVRARAQVNGGDANHELAAGIFKEFQIAQGQQVPRIHHR